MKTTAARKKFKKNFGQSNHFLITSLIALYNLRLTDKNIKCPEDFSTTWNPENLENSISRSRKFILKSYLSFAVDGLDLYFTELNRKPKYIENVKFQEIFDGAGQSVFKKAMGVAEYFRTDRLQKAFIDLLICYRNNMLHFFSENEIKKEHYECLTGNEELIHDKYAGLDIHKLLADYLGGSPPTFKDVATLTKISHEFIGSIDMKIIENLSAVYSYEAVVLKLKEHKRIRENYLAGGFDDRKRIVSNILATYYSFNSEDLETLTWHDLVNIAKGDI